MDDKQLKILLLIFILIFVHKSVQIYDPSNLPPQKPSTYTPGIKSWQPEYHHNYSKVTHQKITNYHPPTVKITPDQNQTIILKKKRQTPKIAIYRKCPPNSTGQFVYELSCNQFLNCWKGRGYPQTCPAGTLFNPKSLECDFISKVECITGPRHTSLSHKIAPIEQIGCPQHFSGLIPNYFNCSQFIECVNGVDRAMICPPGTLFDTDRNVCDHPERANCFNSPKNSPPKYIDDKLDFRSAKKSNCNENRGEIRDCNGRQGLFKHPTNCAKFIQCANGRKFEQDCAPGTLFNEKLSVCDFPNNVECKNQAETVTVTYNQNNGCKHEENENKDYEESHWDENEYQRLKPINGHHYPGSLPSNVGNTDRQYFHNTNYGHKTTQFYEFGTNYDQNGLVQPNTDHFQSPKPNYIGNNNENQGFNYGYSGNNGNFDGKTKDNSNFNGFGSNYNENRFERPNTDQNQPPKSNFEGIRLSNGPKTGYNQNHGTNLGGNYYNTGYESSNFGTMEPNNQNGNSGNFGGTTWNQQPGNPQYTNINNNPKIGGIDPNRIIEPNNGQKPNFNQNGNSGNFGGNPGNYQSGYNRPQIPNSGQDPINPNLGNGFNIDRSDCRGAAGCKPPLSGFYQTNYPHQPSETPINQNHQTKTIHYGGNNYNQNGAQPNYNGVIGAHQLATPSNQRNPYESFYGSTSPRTNDFNDFEHSSPIFEGQITTSRTVRQWPPPFPSTDVNADYVFEYEEQQGELTLDAQKKPLRRKPCEKNDYHCGTNECISINSVCDGKRDCDDGSDEKNCLEYTKRFDVKKGRKLAVLEMEKWYNTTVATCALLCIKSQKFQCKSFNFRHDKTCYLLNANIATTGALISHPPCDYYEKTSTTTNCTNLHKCPNGKCIKPSQKCDGHDDCLDRSDEKGCRREDLGYSISLEGGNQPHEGHLIIKAFGRKGFICDDLFGLRDANVACRELGYSLGAAEVKSNSYFTPTKQDTTTPLYMMDDLDCSGNETTLMDCDFSGWGVHNCNNGEVAGVVCKTQEDKCPQEYWQCKTGRECLPLAFVCDGLLDCSDNSDENLEYCGSPTEIRLINGTNEKEGRLEIRHNGIWGSVCDDDFNEDAAKVVCKSLGFLGGATVKKNAYFGQAPPSAPIWLDQVSCAGNETNLEECVHSEWGEHNCDHLEDVGVVCGTPTRIVPSERHSSRMVFRVPDRCGLRSDAIFTLPDQIHARVVKGSKAKPGQYPWQAAIRVQAKPKLAHWCGAVIISSKFLLTAAHCLVGYSKGAYVIVAGDYDVDTEEGTEQRAFIDDFYIHEQFRKGGHRMNNDIAIIKLKGTGFEMTDAVQPICLPENDDDDGMYDPTINCTISGFGSVQSGRTGFSHEMRAGWVPMQSRAVCTMPHVYGKEMTEGMICAGSLDEGVDACDGDSGGPLACLQNGVFTLFGITSWGQRCGYANKPGVYVKVAHYKDWIEQNLAKMAQETS